MDRRRFLATTGALSLVAAVGELHAATSAFDPTEQSIAALMRALAARYRHLRSPDGGVLEANRPFRSPWSRVPLRPGTQSQRAQGRASA